MSKKKFTTSALHKTYGGLSIVSVCFVFYDMYCPANFSEAPHFHKGLQVTHYTLPRRFFMSLKKLRPDRKIPQCAHYNHCKTGSLKMPAIGMNTSKW